MILRIKGENSRVKYRLSKTVGASEAPRERFSKMRVFSSDETTPPNRGESFCSSTVLLSFAKELAYNKAD